MVTSILKCMSVDMSPQAHQGPAQIYFQLILSFFCLFMPWREWCEGGGVGERPSNIDCIFVGGCYLFSFFDGPFWRLRWWLWQLGRVGLQQSESDWFQFIFWKTDNCPFNALVVIVIIIITIPTHACGDIVWNDVLTICLCLIDDNFQRYIPLLV